jgi:hypothetical protein
LISCEHFIYSSLPGRGLTILKSNSFDVPLEIRDPFGVTSAYQRKYLEDFKEARSQKNFVLNGRPVIGISYLRNTLDDFSRKGIFNHTIIITQEDYIKLGAHPEILEDKFIKNIDKNFDPTSRLVPIQIDEKQPILTKEDLLILQYFEKELLHIIDNLIRGSKVVIRIANSMGEPIKLVYSLLKVLPPTVRSSISFITLPIEISDYKLVVYSSQRPQIDIYNKKETPNLIARDITQAIFEKDINGLQAIHLQYEQANKLGLSSNGIIEIYDGKMISNPIQKLKRENETLERELKYDKAIENQKKLYELTKSIEDLNKLFKLYYETKNFQGCIDLLSQLQLLDEEKLKKIEKFLANPNIDSDFKNKLIEYALIIINNKLYILKNYKRIYESLIDFFEKDKTLLKYLRNQKLTLNFVLDLILMNSNRFPVFWPNKRGERLKQLLVDFDIKEELNLLINDCKHSLLYIYISQLQDLPEYQVPEYQNLIDFMLENYLNNWNQFDEKINAFELLKIMMDKNLIKNLCLLLAKYQMESSKNKFKSFLKKLIENIVDYYYLSSSSFPLKCVQNSNAERGGSYCLWGRR